MSFYLIIFSTLLTVLLGFLRHKYSYWEYQGVKQIQPHFIFGNFFKFSTMHLTELLQEIYDEFKGKAKLAGTYIYTKPFAVIIDLDLVKSILVRDFNKFVDRTEYCNEELDPLSMNLFSIDGEKWRTLRTKLTPTFTSGKMKFMFPTIIKVADEFKEAINDQLRNSVDGNIEIYDFMGRFTTDVIGTCVFGLECNSLKDPNVEFRRIGRRIFYRSHFSIRLRLFLLTYVNYLKYFGRKRFPKDIESFILNVVKETVETREKLNIKRNDFMDLLIELRNTKDENGQLLLSLYQMAAQVFVFFAAGFETSSSNMAFGLYELAKHPEMQEKVREEILNVLEKHDGELTYDAMMEMTYLDQIISETLRKYPPLPSLTRMAGEDYKVPGTDITLEKGVRILIPVRAIHYDPDIYEQPNEFRPERFSPEEVLKRHPQSFLGFGDGPRNCIGLRFARMQVRIGMITLLKSFRFSVSEKTPEKLKMLDRSTMLIPGCGIWLKTESLLN